MNLSKLFELQKPLDEKIVKEKILEGQDLLPQKILALQVELGELANEWRGFKFWSNDQEPRTERVTLWERVVDRWEGDGFDGVLIYKDVPVETINPLLEEYVDCLHFILSIGLDIGVDVNHTFKLILPFIDFPRGLTLFNLLYRQITLFDKYRDSYKFSGLVELFVALGQTIGFTWEQIESAYIAKNKINHQRQATGY